jgi:hypothetical protein
LQGLMLKERHKIVKNVHLAPLRKNAKTSKDLK